MKRRRNSRSLNASALEPRRQVLRKALSRWWFLAGGAFLLLGAGILLVRGPAWQRQRPAPSQEDGQAGGQGPAVPPTQIPGEDLPAPPLTVESVMNEATEMARRLVGRFPNSGDALAVLARDRTLWGKADEAAGYWKKCQEIDPGSGEAHFGLAQNASAKEDYERAAALARKALQIDPTLSEAARFLGNLLTELGRAEEAIAVLEKSLEHDPRSATTYFLLGQAHLQLSEYAKAKARFERAVELRPGYTQAYYCLSMANARLGLKDEAQRHQARFAEMKAKDQAVVREGLARRNDLTEIRSHVASLYWHAGHVYQAHGEPREAERHWLKGAAHDPADATCRLALLRLYRQQDRPNDALRVLDELRRLDPGDPEYELAIGETYVRLRQFEPAEAAFRAACRLAPKDSRGYAVLAQLYVQAGRKQPEAVELARTAVALEPTPQNLAVLAAARERNGDLPGAVAAAERAVKLEPGNPQYRQMYELLKSRR